MPQLETNQAPENEDSDIEILASCDNWNLFNKQRKKNSNERQLRD